MEREVNEREIQLNRENIIIGGIPVDQYYTKDETDLLLAEKANVSSVNVINNEIDSINSEIDDLSLITETGSQIVLSISTSDYKMKALLKDKNGNTIFTSNEIDLPLESVVVDGRYDNTTKKIILTLENGNEIDFSVADLVSGLVSTADLQQELTNYATQQDLQNLPVPVFKYQSSASFELSNKEPGLYVIADSNYAITLKFNNSTKASQLKLLGNTIKVLKKYEDATEGEVFATYVNLGMVLVNGSWYYDGFYFVKVKKYNNDVLIEQDTKWNFPFARIDQNTTISGKYTFTTLPESSVVPTTNDQLVNKAYVDSQAGGSEKSKFYSMYLNITNFQSETFRSGTVYTNFSNIISDAYSENKTPIIITQWGMMTTEQIIDWTQKPTDIQIRLFTTTADIDGNRTSTSELNFSGMMQFIVRMSYSGDTLTVNSIDKYCNDTRYMTTTNTKAYTPTGDYNPATKKYVDDAVAGAGGGLTPITQNTTIWNLDEGIYDVAPGIQLKYNTRNFKITVGDHGLILFVEKVANNRKPFYAMGRGIVSGYPTINHIIMGSAQNDNYGSYELYDVNKLNTAVATSGDYYIYGKFSFSNYLPESSLTPTTNNQLTNKSYVDSAIASAITTTLGGSF